MMITEDFDLNIDELGHIVLNKKLPLKVVRTTLMKWLQHELHSSRPLARDPSEIGFHIVAFDNKHPIVVITQHKSDADRIMYGLDIEITINEWYEQLKEMVTNSIHTRWAIRDKRVTLSSRGKAQHGTMGRYISHCISTIINAHIKENMKAWCDQIEAFYGGDQK